MERKEQLLKGLLNLHPRDFDNTILSEADILQWFQLCDAVWLHDGDHKKPHAELSSGLCSNGYFDCPAVLRYPTLNEILALQLARFLERRIQGTIDWVIGIPKAGVTFSYEIAKFFKAIHEWVEKDPSDPKGKQMLWKRVQIPDGAMVLRVDELLTTGSSQKELTEAVERGNKTSVNFIPVIGALIHRPPKLPAEYPHYEVISLVEKEVWAVPQEECPLCKAGSERIKPKATAENWARLTGKV